MNHSYTHLTGEERYHISALHKTGLSFSDIARIIGRDKSRIEADEHSIKNINTEYSSALLEK